MSEHGFDTFTRHGARLEVLIPAIVSAPLLGALFGYGALSISLVSDDHEWEQIGVCWRCLRNEVALPEGEAFEGGLVADIEGEDAAVRATIEGKAEGVELLLTCRVPDLHSHLGVVDSNVLGLEASTNSSVVVGLSSRELVDQGGLSDTDVAQEDDFGEELFLWVRVYHLFL